jgi:hypothetical protein
MSALYRCKLDLIHLLYLRVRSSIISKFVDSLMGPVYQ